MRLLLARLRRRWRSARYSVVTVMGTRRLYSAPYAWHNACREAERQMQCGVWVTGALGADALIPPSVITEIRLERVL